MIHHSAQGGFAIRDGVWKLVMEGKRQKRELYKLDDDPSETTNVLSQHPEIAARLEREISRIIRQGRTTEGKPQPTEQELAALRAWIAAGAPD